MPLFALIHSPLVGPLTWKLVAQHLENDGHHVIIPTLRDGDQRAFWEQHAGSAARAINKLDFHDGWILAGHSGAGPLLPLIGAQLNAPVAAYIFVDAGLPQNQASHLDMLKVEIPEVAKHFETFLKTGGQYPQWQDADLQPLIPDDTLRQRMLNEIRPRALSFFTEPLPAPEAWDTIPSGYIQFSEGYAVPAEQARKKGWPVIEFQAGHFHTLVEPTAVATALTKVADQLIKSA